MAANRTPPKEDAIRPHVFDGIAEYDKKLPNWWLLTFYVSIVFAILYWLDMQRFAESTPQSRLEVAMQEIEAIRLASNTTLDDATLWQMSRNPTFVTSGADVFKTNCASCHGNDLKGGIGANLIDGEWLHGGQPMQVYHTVDEGVLAKGMPAWGGVLGQKKVIEAVAFVLSHHTPPAAE